MGTHFGGRHVGHRAMSLNSLQLVEAPVQLLQSLQGHLRVGLICRETVVRICNIASKNSHHTLTFLFLHLFSIIILLHYLLCPIHARRNPKKMQKDNNHKCMRAKRWGTLQRSHCYYTNKLMSKLRTPATFFGGEYSMLAKNEREVK